MNVVLLSCLFLLMVTTSVSASMNINAHRGRIPIIFANRDKMSKTNSYRRGRRGSTNTELGSNSNHHDSIKNTRIQNTSSSRSYSKYYTSNEFEDGEDAFDEWDRLERMKKDLQKQLGGYRPWSIDTSSSRLGKVSWTSKLVLTNLVMFGLQMAMPSITKFGAKRSELILQGRELHRLITPIFLHGSPTHIMLNTFSLRNIGPEVERLFGGGRFLTTYLAAGVAGNLMSAYYSPNPSIGASGAVFGLMGAYYAFLSQNERLLGRSGQDAMSRVSGTLAMNVLFGLASPGIDNWAHIGGAIGGGKFEPSIHLAYYYLFHV
jgi:membrane associated rhomboid family serine protease